MRSAEHIPIFSLSKSVFFIIAACLIWFKFFAFQLYINQCGQDAIFLPDSASYVNLSDALIKNKAFAHGDQNGVLVPEIFRTPGYPVLLAILSGVFQFEFIQVIYFQIFVSILTAFIIYKTMNVVNPGLKHLCSLFVLFDFSITYNSMHIMTETLFTGALAGFLYFFVIYLNSGKTRDLLIAAFLSALCIYIRPIGYYLPYVVIACYFFSFYKKSSRRVIAHSVLFIIVVSFLLSLWHLRNYLQLGEWRFSSIGDVSYDGDGIIGSYKRLNVSGVSPWIFYPWNFLNLIRRVLTHTTLMTFPNAALTEIFKIITLSWIDLWKLGLVLGLALIRKNVYLRFFLVVIVYLTAAPVFAANLGAGERFRVPMYPCIALIAATGWHHIYTIVKTRSCQNIRKSHKIIIPILCLSFYALCKFIDACAHAAWSGEFELMVKALITIFSVWLVCHCLYRDKEWAWWICVPGTFIFSLFGMLESSILQTTGSLHLEPYPIFNAFMLTALPVFLFMAFITLLFSKPNAGESDT